MNDVFYTPQKGETVNEYIQRMSALRDIYGFTWNDICDNVFEQFGEALTANAVQKRAKRLSQLSREQVVETQNDETNDVTEETDIEIPPIKKLQMERYKLRDELTQANALYRRMSRENTIKEVATQVAGSMNGKSPLKCVRTIDRTSNKKEAILMISDWHYGIEIDNCYNVYNTEVCKDRVSELRDKVIGVINRDKITDLTVANLGDMIAGNIHLPIRLNSRIDVITQVIQVSEILSYFLNSLSEKCHIKYYSVFDNHSRIDPNKKDAIRLEQLSRITDWYLRTRLENNQNVEFNSDFDYGFDIATFSVCDKKVLCVHGDVDKQCSMIDKLSAYTQDHWDVICSAHMHHFSANESNNTLLLSNGSLMGTDSYAESLRLNSSPSQTMVEFTNNGDYTILKLNIGC